MTSRRLSEAFLTAKQMFNEALRKDAPGRIEATGAEQLRRASAIPTADDRHGSIHGGDLSPAGARRELISPADPDGRGIPRPLTSACGYANNRTPGQITASVDPVDLATGEFLLPQIDLELPGVLPLVLSRRHRSNYRWGHWFGPSWSTTFDMRVVVERHGITVIAEDGVLVAYPLVHAGVTARPSWGELSWTLARTQTGGYRFTDTDQERCWHFDPLPDRDLDPDDTVIAVSAVTDRHGNRIDFHYNANGAPTAVSHSGGYRVLVRTASGRVTGLSMIERNANDPDTARRIRTFGYEDGQLTTVTNAVGADTRFTYDAADRMTSWTDSNATRMEIGYDDVGRVNVQSGTGGVLNTWFEYSETVDRHVTEVTDALESSTTYRFDTELRLRELIDATGASTRYDYETQRRPVRITAPDGAVTHYRYNESAHVVETIRPDGGVVTVGYQSPKRPETVTDADGRVTRYEWDDAENLTAAIDPTGNRTEYSYHANGAVAGIRETSGRCLRIDVDPAGLPVRVSTPDDSVTRIERDFRGLPIRITDPLGSVDRYRWTASGELSEWIDPDDHVETRTYDGEGNLLTHTDRAGGETRYEYGVFDLPITCIDPDSAVTRFEWDAVGRLATVVDPLGNTWTWLRDPVGSVLAATDCNGATTRYHYNLVGKVDTVIAPTGSIRRYRYDPLGRTTEITTDTGSHIHFEYDLGGRILTATSGSSDDPGHVVRLSYNRAGLLETEQLDRQPTMRHEYNAAGRRIARITPSGAVTWWSYDPADRIRSVTANGLDIELHHDALNRPSGQRIGVTTISRTITATGQVTSRSVSVPPASGVPKSASGERCIGLDSYRYRPDGYLVKHAKTRGDDVVRTAYRLDRGGKVTSIVRDDIETECYTYDSLGNITAAGPPDASAAESARSYRQNLLVGHHRTSYDYDPAGRLVRVARAPAEGESECWHYSYDPFDHLTEVRTPTRQRWRYRYDAFGRRVAKWQVHPNGEIVDSIEYTWDGTQLAEQVTGSVTTRWIYEPGTHTPIAQTTDRGDGSPPDSYAILTDLVGMPIELVDARTGRIAGTGTADLWGLVRWDGSVDTPLRFPGQIHDPESGLHYNVHRYYDPRTGRFLTQDPLGLAATLNPNTYPHNPTCWIDPLGLMPCMTLYRGMSGHEYNDLRVNQEFRLINGGPKYFALANPDSDPSLGNSAALELAEHFAKDAAASIHYGVVVEAQVSLDDHDYNRLMTSTSAGHHSWPRDVLRLIAPQELLDVINGGLQRVIVRAKFR